MLAKLERWQDIKFGLLMHWGPYSQWGIVESWSICAEDEGWCKRSLDDYIEYKRRYEGLQKTFNPVAFDPARWARAARDAGMQYVVFTTKHHDGFCMFDTKHTDYKVTRRDAVSREPAGQHREGDLRRVPGEGFLVGAYFSKPDWHSGTTGGRTSPRPTATSTTTPSAIPSAGTLRRVHAQPDHGVDDATTAGSTSSGSTAGG